MTLPETISADYTLRPSELAEMLATLVKARQPTLVWGPPGAAKSMIARQVASNHGYKRGFHEGVKVRAPNEVDEWGPSDHCRLLIEVASG